MSSDHQVQQIKDRIDIVDFIGEYVRLAKSGINYKACCPFHNEKTPSFMVSRDRGTWHCFGCNEGGDSISFLQKIEGLTFPEALKILADRAGVKLERSHDRKDEVSPKNVAKDILSLAAQVYHRILLDAPGARSAAEYLAKRGVDGKTRDAFLIGFAPDQWDVLTKYLCKRGIGVTDQFNAGLVIKSDRGSYYDRFRGRIMFPINDHHGHAVGFTGRLLQEKDGQGKYVNSPQTDLFDKGKILYGLDKAKRAIQTKGEAIIVEGQMDVVASHQFGFENTIASSGTALTSAQLQLLKRYTTVLKIAFDQDVAGEKASTRGIALALKEGFDVRVICPRAGVGKDADEILRKNVSVWEEAVSHAMPFVRWSIMHACTHYDVHSPKGKSQIVQEVAPFIKEIPGAVERDAWIGELGKTIGVRAEIVLEEIHASRTRLSTSIEGPIREEKQSTSFSPKPISSYDALLALYIGESYQDERVFEIPIDCFDTRFHSLYNFLKQGYTNDDFVQSIEENTVILRMLCEHVYGDFDGKKRAEEFEKLLVICKEKTFSARKDSLEQMIRDAEAENDTEKVRMLMNEFHKLFTSATN